MGYEIKPLTRETLARLEKNAPALVLMAQVGMGTNLTPDDALSLIQFAVWNRDRIWAADETEPPPYAQETLSADKEREVQIPEGWALVPMEPTPDMLAKAWAAPAVEYSPGNIDYVFDNIDSPSNSDRAAWAAIGVDISKSHASYESYTWGQHVLRAIYKAAVSAAPPHNPDKGVGHDAPAT